MQLHQLKSEIVLRNTGVSIITFNPSPLANKWIEETRSSFQFLVDPERKAYQAYGLETSLIRSWSPKVWIAYARLLLLGRKWPGIQGDSSQLGGDFIIDRQGIIRMAHRSHDPTDRPRIEEIIRVLDELAN